MMPSAPTRPSTSFALGRPARVGEPPGLGGREPLARRGSWAALAIFLISLSAACGGGDTQGGGGEWEAQRDTVGDTVTVRTVSGSVWEGPAELVPEVRIGQFEGPDEYIFGQVSSLAVGPDGTIYVLDSQVPALRVYEPDGTFRATWGREGGGPGEYQRPRALGVLSDGRVLVRDPGNGRITVFSPQGEPLDTWPIRGSFSTSRPLYVDHEDNAYYALLLDPEAGLEDWEIGLLRIHPDGTTGDTLRPPSTGFEAPYVEARTENSWSRTSVPFSPSESWHFSPLGYFVSGLSTRYALDLHEPDGTVLRIAREAPPVPVDPGEADQRKDAITRNFQESYGTWRWNGPDIPGEKPPYRSFFLDQAGRVWIALSQPGVEEENPTYDPEDEASQPTVWSEPPLFDVFEPDGRYLGQVRPPTGFSGYPQPVIRGDTVWAVIRDELDVQQVVRFRLRREADPPATQ